APANLSKVSPLTLDGLALGKVYGLRTSAVSSFSSPSFDNPSSGFLQWNGVFSPPGTVTANNVIATLGATKNAFSINIPLGSNPNTVAFADVQWSSPADGKVKHRVLDLKDTSVCSFALNTFTCQVAVAGFYTNNFSNQEFDNLQARFTNTATIGLDVSDLSP